MMNSLKVIILCLLFLCARLLFSENQEMEKEEPLIPETCTIHAVSWLMDKPETKYSGEFYINNGVVTASKGVYAGNLRDGHMIVGGWRSQGDCGMSWCEEKIVFYPDGTLKVSPIWHTCTKDKNGGIAWQTQQYFFSGTWRIISPIDATSTASIVGSAEPSKTLAPNEELESVGKVEGQERYIALPENPNADEMTLPRMREYINQLMDGYKQAKEMYLDAKARVKALEDEEKDLRLSVAAWESQETNIDTERISGQLREHHLKIKELDEQFDQNVQESIIGQKLPDLNQTGGVDKLNLNKDQISNIKTRNEALETQDYTARTEIRSEAETAKASAAEFMKIQNEHRAKEAFEQSKILELNDQLKRHRELNQKIEQGKDRMEKLEFEIENGKEKVANYLAICQQGREKLRVAYEQYKALEEKKEK